MESFIDEDMKGLPDDDNLALVVYEARLNSQMQQNLDANGWWAERRYVNHLLAFISVTNLDIGVDSNPPVEANEFGEWYNHFSQKIDHAVVAIKIAHARGTGSQVVSAVLLSTEYKAEIHSLLGKIRKIINQTDLSDNKKDAIYEKISALQSEIDKSKTRFDAFLSRFLDLTNMTGEAAENLEPLAKLLERVMKAFGRAKADHDAGKLAPPEATPKLPAPENLDDEIPF